MISQGRLYTYGGHLAGAHSWSLETTSGKLRALDLQQPTTWVDLPGGPPVQSPGLTEAAGKIYLVGGMQPQNEKGKPAVLKSLDHALVFDPATKSWTDLPKLPEARSSHDIAVLDGKLYAVGGWPLDTSKDAPEKEADDRHHVRTFHNTSLVLDLANPSSGWQSFPQPFERRALAVVANSGKLYAIGGMDAKNELSNAVDVYDVASKSWSKIQDLPAEGKVKSFAVAACALDGRVIASPRGGKIFALSSDNTWSEVAKLSGSRFFHQLEPWNHSVIALGGTTGDKPLNTVEIVTIPHLPKPPAKQIDQTSPVRGKTPSAFRIPHSQFIIPMRLLTFALVALTCSLPAHEVWIEDTTDGKLVVRFAEYGEEYEKSPGHLDSLKTPEAWTAGDDGKPKVFEVQKKSDHYLLVDAKPENGAQAEAAFAVMKRGDSHARKPIFYARWHQAKAGAATPALTFDIVPTATAGEVQVFFRGQPVS